MKDDKTIVIIDPTSGLFAVKPGRVSNRATVDPDKFQEGLRHEFGVQAGGYYDADHDRYIFPANQLGRIRNSLKTFGADFSEQSTPGGVPSVKPFGWRSSKSGEAGELHQRPSRNEAIRALEKAISVITAGQDPDRKPKDPLVISPEIAAHPDVQRAQEALSAYAPGALWKTADGAATGHPLPHNFAAALKGLRSDGRAESQVRPRERPKEKSASPRYDPIPESRNTDLWQVRQGAAADFEAAYERGERPGPPRADVNDEESLARREAWFDYARNHPELLGTMYQGATKPPAATEPGYGSAIPLPYKGMDSMRSAVEKHNAEDRIERERRHIQERATYWDAYDNPNASAFVVKTPDRHSMSDFKPIDLPDTPVDQTTTLPATPDQPVVAERPTPVGRERSKAAQAAAMIRGELRRRGIKARVKSSNFSQGDSVDVYATDLTPEQREGVEKLISQFRYGDFDGRTDSYDANNRRADIPQAKYVDLTPEYSDQLQQQAWDYFRQQRNVDAPADLKEAERQGGRIDGEPASTWVWQVLQGSEGDFWSRSKADASVTPAQGGEPLPAVAESPAPEARPRRRQSESAQAAAMVRAEMNRRGINGSVSTNRIGNIHIRTTDLPPDEVARLERFSQEFQREHYDAENDYWVPRSRDDIPQGGFVSAVNTPSSQMRQRVWSYIRIHMGLDAPEDYNEALEARTQYNDLWPQQYVHMVFTGRQLNFWRQGEVSEVLDGRIPPTLGNPYYGRHIYQDDPALLGDRVGKAGPDVGDDSSSASAEPLEPPPPPLDTMDQGPAVDADAAVDEVADRIQDQQDSADPPASIEPVEEPEPEIDPPVSSELSDPPLEAAETEAASMPEPEADDATPPVERPIEADEPTPDEPVEVERAELKPRTRRPRTPAPPAEAPEEPESVADPGDVSAADSGSIEAALEVLRRRRDKPVNDPAESTPAAVPTPTPRERPSAMTTGRRKKKKGKGNPALKIKHGRAFVQYKRQGDTFVRE